MTTMRYLAPILGLVLVACGGGSTLTSPSVSFRVIGVGGGFIAEQPGARLIQDPAAWADFVRQFGVRASPFDPNAPLPAIDFASQAAVAIFPGARPSAGYDLEVTGVERSGSGVLVRVAEQTPCMAAFVITYPLVVIAIPKGLTPVDVAWTVRPCSY